MLSQLIKKEIRLQRSNIYFAVAVFLVWCLDFLIALLGDQTLGSKIITTGTLAQIGHYFFVLPGLIAIFPIMAGAASITQERKLGTFDGEAIQPVSRRTKFIVKTGVPLFLSLLLGGVLLGIMDHIFVWNLRIHDIPWSLGKREFTPLPFRMKGLFPGFFCVLFCALGIYVSSTFKDPYKALISTFAFLVLTLLSQRLVDPAGMLFPLGETFPDQYIHPLIHYLRIIFLSLFLLWMGFRNFHPQPRKIKTFCLQVFFWILLVNITGYFALRWEFNPGISLEPETTQTPGFTRLLELKNADLSCPLLRIPNSSKIATSTLMEKDKLYFTEHRLGSYSSGHIVEISIDTGRKRVVPGLFGNIKEFSPVGKYYTVEQSITKQSYNITHSGMVIPSKMFDKLKPIFGYSSDPPFSWKKSFYRYQFPKKMVLKTSSKDIVYEDVYLIPRKKVGDIEEYQIHRINDEQLTSTKYINLLVRRKGSPDTYELIDRKEGNFPFWLSPDGKWYANSRIMYPENLEIAYDYSFKELSPERRGKIISTDGSTSYTIQGDDNVAILIYYFDIRSNNNMMFTQKFAPQTNISLSPDGHFLLFISIPSESLEMNRESFSQKGLEFRILDLKNGRNILLEKVPESQLSRKRHEYLKQEKHSLPYMRYKMLNRFTYIPCVWSNDYKLAILYDENLYVYRYIQGEDRFIILGKVHLTDAMYPDPGKYYYLTIEFWSDDILLFLTMSQYDSSSFRHNYSLWKLDLRQCKLKKKI